MNFQTSVKTCLVDKYATFSGRASRSEYWWFILALVIASVVFTLIGIRVLYLVYMLAVLCPTVAAGFRRLQDTGKPGWYILFPIGLSVLNTFLAPAPTMDGAVPQSPGLFVMVLGVIGFAVALVFIYLLTRPSDPEPNAYGPPPAA